MKRTNVVIDEKLLEEGMRVTGLKTYKELIDTALRDLVRREKQLGIRDLRGTIQWEGDLDEIRSLR
ncbi:MAG: type II toxin-antitoxin system VapB family antitoxin [Thermodesulfobacteriota bacterium]